MDMISSWSETFSAYTGLQPWTFAVFLVVLAALLADFVQRRLMRRLGKVVEQSENNWDDAMFDAAVWPISLLIWLIGITTAAELMPVFDVTGEFGDGLVIKIRQVGIVFALAWFLVKFIKNIENNVSAEAREGKKRLDETTVRALGRVLRITVIVTATLVGLDTLGVNVAGLMAAGGIGGLAVGLAARDMIANFFGGLTVFMDRPFSIGDWILLKDQGIEGTVENIGWRQTTIRKFDKRPVYVPNAVFTTASVETPSRMTHRRIRETIGLRYDDLNSLEQITLEVKEMLRSHPEIDDSQTLMVNFDTFGPSSLDFFIYCLTHTVNWQKYHEVKQDVLLKITDIIDRNGASVAYPTQRVQLEGALSPEGREATQSEQENG